MDVKMNAPHLLKKQLRRIRSGTVALSTVTDPYQPLERKYELTRKCLEVLLEKQLEVNVLTRSSLCLRDIDLFEQFESIRVGFSIPTQDERIRKIFEPHSPSIESRIRALAALHQKHVRTYAFVGPMLPLDPKQLVALLSGVIDEALVDRMNYPNKVKAIYRRNGLEAFLEDDYFFVTGEELREGFEKNGIEVSMIC